MQLYCELVKIEPKRTSFMIHAELKGVKEVYQYDDKLLLFIPKLMDLLPIR